MSRRVAKSDPRASSPVNSTDGVDGSCDSTLDVLQRAQRGDRSAVDELIERAHPVLRRWARGRLPAYARNDANTEDVVQDAVLATLKNLDRFRHRTVNGLQAYLRTSVMSRIYDLIRRSRRRGVPAQLSDQLRDEGRTPLEEAILRQGLERFLVALQRLSAKDRQVIIWRIELGYRFLKLPLAWASPCRRRG